VAGLGEGALANLLFRDKESAAGGLIAASLLAVPGASA